MKREDDGLTAMTEKAARVYKGKEILLLKECGST